MVPPTIADITFVLGMHRSGTSLVTRLVASEGIGLPDDLFPGNPFDNPDGYQESRTVVGIHNHFLTEIGSHWKDPGPLPPGSFQSPAASVACRSIREFLRSYYGKTIVLKDPRLCRLLPLWLQVITEWKPNVRIVQAIRRNRAVHQSLSRRVKNGRMPHAGIAGRHHSDLLWWRYVSEARLNSKGLPRLVLAYEELVENPKKYREFLRQFLDLQGEASVPEAWQRIRKGEPSASEYLAEGVDSNIQAFLNWIYESSLQPGEDWAHLGQQLGFPLVDFDHPYPADVYESLSAALLKKLSSYGWHL